MSTKLVRYKDVCNAVIPMIADMLQKGDVEPAINTLKVLGALEDVDPAKVLGALEDVDPAKVLKEYCGTQPDDCKGCRYWGIGGHDGCAFDDVAPEDWEI